MGNAWLFRLLEWHDMRFVMDVMRPGDLFIDVGSNVGVYTLLATTCPGVEVLAFEPGRLARDRLEEHLDLNHVRDRVEVSPFVLSDHTGEIQFTVGRDVTNHVVTDVTTSDGTETLPVRRLDDVVAADAFKRPVLLKVDAEGHDLRVLLGARRLLEEVRPPIIVEWNDPEIISLLVPLGYRPYIYSPDNRTLTESDWATSGTSNVLAIADRAAVEERLRDR